VVAEVMQSDPIAHAVAGLAHLAVGPGLAAALATFDLASLTLSQCLDVMVARYRQANHERGQFFAIVNELIHRQQPDRADPVVGPDGPPWAGEFAADEVRAALVLTRRAAQNLCAFAEDLAQRLPAVLAAFADGVIDQPRARVFSHWTACLAADNVAAIVAALLPTALPCPPPIEGPHRVQVVRRPVRPHPRAL
jgi:hypothetical protein